MDYKQKILSIIESVPDEAERARLTSEVIDLLGQVHATLTSGSASDLKRKYLRDWRSKNKDKVRAYNKRYWSKKASKYGR